MIPKSLSFIKLLTANFTQQYFEVCLENIRELCDNVIEIRLKNMDIEIELKLEMNSQLSGLVF